MSDVENYDIIIEPNKTASNYWLDLWKHRELLFFLAWRDIKVLYKQTVIGILWSLIRPLIPVVVFTIVFGRIAKLPSSGIPYPILVYSGMLAWQLFANSFQESSNSLVANGPMLTKVYFPRLIFLLSTFFVAFVDFLISFGIFLIMMLVYQYPPSIKMLILPVFIFMCFLSSFGLSLWFSALNVKYRDFRYIIPFAVQFGFFISPVGFTSQIVSAKWKFLYYLNPIVGIIDGFRWATTGAKIDLYLPGFLISIFIIFTVLFSGLWFFRKSEKKFADFI